MSIVVETKSAGTVRKEELVWTAEMAMTSPADEIATSTWTANNGLIIDTDANTTTNTTATISGGRLGAYCLLKNAITTTGGFEYERTLVIEITPT